LENGDIFNDHLEYFTAIFELLITIWYILCSFGTFCVHLVHFVFIWYILYSFGTFFPVLVSCTKKNLATLDPIVSTGTSTCDSFWCCLYSYLRSIYTKSYFLVVQHIPTQIRLISICVKRCHTISEGVVHYKNNLSCRYVYTP
jgi:hypothetical protein